VSGAIPIKRYRPSNGSEGECFVADWCGTCERDHGMLKGLPLEECDDNRVCEIIGKTYLYNVDDPEYPAEWTYDKNGAPCCTAYVEEGKPVPVKDDKTGDLFGTTGEKP
jgi:hypothetical protein